MGIETQELLHCIRQADNVLATWLLRIRILSLIKSEGEGANPWECVENHAKGGLNNSVRDALRILGFQKTALPKFEESKEAEELIQALSSWTPREDQKIRDCCRMGRGFPLARMASREDERC